MHAIPCGLSEKVLGPKTQEKLNAPLVQNSSHEEDGIFGIERYCNTIRFSVPSIYSGEDLELLHSKEIHGQIRPAFGFAPLCLNHFKMWGILDSSDLIRAGILAERAAWKFKWTHAKTIGYLEGYRERAEKAFTVTARVGVEHLSVGYIMLGLAAFSGQLEHVLGNARMVLGIIGRLNEEECHLEMEHKVWVLQVVNGVLTILKHSVGFPGLECTIGVDFWNEVVEILNLCRQLAKFQGDPDIGQGDLSYGSLKVSILWQLLEIHARSYCHTEPNFLYTELFPFSDILDQLLEFITAIRQHDSSAKTGQSRNTMELELFDQIYHLGILIRHSSILPDPVIAFHSAFAVDRVSPLETDPFGRCIAALTLLFALPVLAQSGIRTFRMLLHLTLAIGNIREHLLYLNGEAGISRITELIDEMTTEPVWTHGRLGKVFEWWFNKSMFVPSYIGEVRLRPETRCEHNWFDCYNE